MVNEEVRRYVPACLHEIAPSVWAHARMAKSIPQAYRIIKKVEHLLPFPWPEPLSAMTRGKRRQHQSPVEFMGRQVGGGRFLPHAERKLRDGQPQTKRRRVEPRDITVVKVALPPKAKAQPVGRVKKRLPRCYIGDVTEDGTYEYGPNNQPRQAKDPASEATEETSAEFHARNRRDFEKWGLL